MPVVCEQGSRLTPFTSHSPILLFVFDSAAEAQDLSNQFTKVCQAIFPAAELARNVAHAKEPFLQRPGAREEEQQNIRVCV